MVIEIVSDGKCSDCGHEDDGYHYGTCVRLRLAELERAVVEAALASYQAVDRARNLNSKEADNAYHHAQMAVESAAARLLAARSTQVLADQNDTNSLT